MLGRSSPSGAQVKISSNVYSWIQKKPKQDQTNKQKQWKNSEKLNHLSLKADKYNFVLLKLQLLVSAHTPLKL